MLQCMEKRGKSLAIRSKEIIKETMQLCIKKTLLNGPKLVCFDLIKQKFFMFRRSERADLLAR